MTDKPFLPRVALTGGKARARKSVRFPINWRTVQEVAGVTVELSEIDRANVESAALRCRLELDRERAGDGISFGKMRGQAGKIAAAAEKLRGLLIGIHAPSFVNADLEALKRLQCEARSVADSDTGGQGSPAYSFDLRESLLSVLAGRWHEANGDIACAPFYRAGAEVLRQVNPDQMTEDESREKAVSRFVDEWKNISFEL